MASIARFIVGPARAEIGIDLLAHVGRKGVQWNLRRRGRVRIRVGKGEVDRVDRVDRDSKGGRGCRDRDSRCSRKGVGVRRVLGRSRGWELSVSVLCIHG